MTLADPRPINLPWTSSLRLGSTSGMNPTPLPDDALQRSREFAAKLGQVEWQLEAEPELVAEPEPEHPANPSPPPVPIQLTKLFNTTVIESDAPPPPERILEAMLFIGGPPLTPAAVENVLRGSTAEKLREMVETLNRIYRTQNRPYSILPKDNGYVLTVKPNYRGVKEKLFGGPREARLSQPALDVLSLIAYRQPILKADIDAMRGVDSGGIVRQLVRLGLVVVVRRAEAETQAVCYGTTSRFLDLFKLTSLDDLPRLGDPQLVTV